MAIYGAAYELTFNRDAAGAAIHPNGQRLYQSYSAWADASSILRQTLSRGYIPYPATGDAPVIRRVSGVSRATVGGPFSLAGNARDAFADFNGATTTSVGQDFIQRCGYNNLFVGRGRAAGGDMIVAAGNLRTALLNGGAAT